MSADTGTRGARGRAGRGLAAALAAAACITAFAAAGADGTEDAGLRARVAAADPKAGYAAFSICPASPAYQRHGEAMIGPNLWGIVGRPVASEPGFDYSDALLALGGDWTLERLDRIIANPNALVPGNTMGFYGIRNERERLDILAYLLTLQDGTEPAR